MKQVTLLLSFGLLIISCKIASSELMSEKQRKEKMYFPSSKNESNKEANDTLNDFVNQWYSKHLYSLKEPILYDKTKKGLYIFRYTNLGTWSQPYSYRIEFKDSVVTIEYKRTNGQGGYTAGRLIEKQKQTLKIDTWKRLIEKVDSVRFWEMQTQDKNIILDGEEWILEGLYNEKYHFITRRSPDVYDGKDYVELCKIFIELYNTKK